MKKTILTLFTVALGAVCVTSCGPSKAELAEQARQDSIRRADSIALAEQKAAEEAAAAAAKAKYEQLHNKENIEQMLIEVYDFASKNGDKKAAKMYCSEEFIRKGSKYHFYPCFRDSDGSSDGTCVVSSFKLTKAEVKEMDETTASVLVTKKTTVKNTDYEYNKVWYTNYTETQTVKLILEDDEWKIDDIIFPRIGSVFKYMYNMTQCG